MSTTSTAPEWAREAASRAAKRIRSHHWLSNITADELMVSSIIIAELADIASAAPPVATDEQTYQRRLYDECVTAGWDAGKQNTFAEEIAHLHEELSEAFREYRKHKDFAIRVDENGKPQGIPIELADVLIGLFYNAELHGFDLFAAVEQKHRFNLTRNYNAEGRQLHVVEGSKDTP